MKKAVVVCGSHRVEWETLSPFSAWLGLSAAASNEAANGNAVAMMEYLRGEGRIGLLELLVATSHLDARVPQVKIFGVLGVGGV